MGTRLGFWGVAVAIGCIFFVMDANAATYTVNATGDTTDGTCVHPFVDAASDCTLREAITAAGASAGSDDIVFDIHSSFADDGDGQWTITVTSALPTMSQPTLISAASEWDADDDRPGIRVSATTGLAGFTFSSGAGASELKALEIVGFSTAVRVNVGATGVMIGTDCDGVADDTERNVIRGSGTQTILLDDVTDVIVRGNYIGTLSDGITASTFGSFAIKLQGATTDNNLIGFEEGTSGTCDPDVQRNVIGGGGNANNGAIQFESDAASDLDGDATIAPDGNRISGNYIGIGGNGTSDIGLLGHGIHFRRAATMNTVGTDGDGIDDAFERNVVGGWGSNGIFIFRTGLNRVSGNLVGFTADESAALGNGTNGVVIRGTGNIVGWCDASVNATLCNDGGVLDDQRNISGNNGQDGIALGALCVDCLAYGNICGTDVAGTMDFGNGENGIFIHRGDDGAEVGGSTPNHRNVIMFNGLGGILLDGYSSGSEAGQVPPTAVGPTENYVIENNVISENDDYGIHVFGTEQDGTIVGPTDGEVVDNVILDNAGSGMIIEASSPLVNGNTIEDNGGYGMELRSSFRYDDPTGGTLEGTLYENPYDALSPNEATEDSVSEPTITSNTIDGNTSGGIFILDADLDNLDTVLADNVVGTNGTFDLRRDWYAAAEVLDEAGDPIVSGLSVVRFTPANDLSCTSTCSGATFASAGAGEGIWGMAGITYDDASTWFQLTQFIFDTSGTRVDYSPYTLRFSGPNGLSGAVGTSIDGDESNEMIDTHLPAGITTESIDRYQISQVSESGGSDDPLDALPSAPVALTPVALSDSTIRWYFDDTANNETGFQLIEMIDGHVRPLVDSGVVATQDLHFLDEINLNADQEYCDRFIIAVNGAGESSATALPCVRTLASGSVAETIGIPILEITQAAFLVMPPSIDNVTRSVDGLMLSFIAFGPIATIGYLHSTRLQRRGCSDRTCRSVYAGYVGFGMVTLVSVFVLSQWYVMDVRADEETMVPISPALLLRNGDTIRFDILIQNEGTATAIDARLVDTLPSGLLEKETGNQTIEMILGSIGPEDEVSVLYEVVVSGASGSVDHTVQVLADGMLPAISNAVTLTFEEVAAGIPRTASRLIKSHDSSTVYFVDDDGTRRPFWNEPVYFSWYADFSDVVKVSDEKLAAIPMGRPMLVRPGTWLVKAPYSPVVYTIEPGGLLRPISSETRARQLFGGDWALTVIDLDDAFLSHYEFGEVLEPGEFPTGLVATDGQRTCYIDDPFCREVSESGKRKNRFFDRFIRLMSPARLDILFLAEPITDWEPLLLRAD